MVGEVLVGRTITALPLHQMAAPALAPRAHAAWTARHVAHGSAAALGVAVAAVVPIARVRVRSVADADCAAVVVGGVVGVEVALAGTTVLSVGEGVAALGRIAAAAGHVMVGRLLLLLVVVVVVVVAGEAALCDAETVAPVCC